MNHPINSRHPAVPAPGVDAEELVVELATRQHGIVTRRQLLAAGVSPKVVDRRVARGLLRPMHRGVYLLGSLRGGLTPERAHEMAAVLVAGPDAALSHRSAGRLWGLLRGRDRRNHVQEAWQRRTDRSGRPIVDVTIPHRSRRQRPGVRVHRPADLTADDVTRVDGIPVTTPGRTLRDLSTVLGLRDLNRAAARAVREGLVEATDFPGLVDRHGSRPGAPVLRTALLGPDGLVLTRSEAEERFLELVREAGLPQPRVNARVEGYEVDFFWAKEQLVVEVDGFAFHSSRDSFEADRRRDSTLEAKGMSVLRVTWRQLVRERVATVARIGSALGHGAARAG